MATPQWHRGGHRARLSGADPRQAPFEHGDHWFPAGVGLLVGQHGPDRWRIQRPQPGPHGGQGEIVIAGQRRRRLGAVFAVRVVFAAGAVLADSGAAAAFGAAAVFPAGAVLVVPTTGVIFAVAVFFAALATGAAEAAGAVAVPGLAAAPRMTGRSVTAGLVWTVPFRGLCGPGKDWVWPSGPGTVARSGIQT